LLLYVVTPGTPTRLTLVHGVNESSFIFIKIEISRLMYKFKLVNPYFFSYYLNTSELGGTKACVKSGVFAYFT
jgi:hypothetical protein